ncbi:MAG: hypothetical protein ACE5FS_09510, partial [Paracoccaceae bacterium]
MRWIVLFFALVGGLAWANAQESGDDDNSFIVKLLEDQLSSETRQIRLSGIDGLLSSDARVAEITIADTRGVWLRIVNASISWRRAQLMTGRLDIDRLAAERIIIARRPDPAQPGLPKPEATRFRLPDLPLAVNLSRLDIGSVEIAASVFGLETHLGATGAFSLDGGELSAAFDATDLSGAGGRLHLSAAFSNETETLDLDVSLDEAENGIAANLLGLPGRPPVALRLNGSGPVHDLDLGMTVDLGDRRVVDGSAKFRGMDDGLIAFDLALLARLQGVVSPEVAPFFGERSDLAAQGSTRAGGGIRIDRFSVTSSALDLKGSLTVSGDGFPESLLLSSSLKDNGGKTPLPVGGGQVLVSSAQFDLAYGMAGAEDWKGRLFVRGFETPEFSLGTVDLNLKGIARGLSDPKNRTIAFNMAGEANAITSSRPEIADALGRRLELAAEGAWSAGTPVVIRMARIAGNNFKIAADGNIRGVVLDGNLHLATRSIAPFSRLANRSLSGALTLDASGRYEPLSGIFDLVLDGMADDLRFDKARLDPLLVGHTSLRGRLARSEKGLTTDGFRLSNDQIEFSSSGTISSAGADLEISATLADINLITDQATGQLRLTGSATNVD